jgi:hypothetical protein
LIAYFLCTLALWPLLYDHLDLVLAALVMAALALLVSPYHYIWSFAVLALAINFKLVPIVLAPIWLVGSLPLYAGRRPWPTTLAVLAQRAVSLAALVSACFLPFYAWYGAPTLGFFTYHRERGVEINSIYSSLIMLGNYLGFPANIYFQFGGNNIRSPWSHFLAAASPWISVIALAALVFAFLRAYRRQMQARTWKSPVRSFAMDNAEAVASYALLALLLLACTSKVLSPQYMVWFPPLVVLVAASRRRRLWFLSGFLAACWLTKMLCTDWWVKYLLVPGADGAYTGPKPLGAWALGLRNVLLVLLTAWLAQWLWSAGSEQADLKEEAI